MGGGVAHACCTSTYRLALLPFFDIALGTLGAPCDIVASFVTFGPCAGPLPWAKPLLKGRFTRCVACFHVGTLRCSATTRDPLDVEGDDPALNITRLGGGQGQTV